MGQLNKTIVRQDSFHVSLSLSGHLLFLFTCKGHNSPFLPDVTELENARRKDNVGSSAKP
jgi:hypothetical protein